MAVNDKRVLEIILQTLQKYRSENPGCARAWRAATDLYERRNDPKNPRSSLDEDLAAAEHCMVARAYVACGKLRVGDAVSWIIHYQGAKTVLPNKWLRHNKSKPSSPPSTAQTKWALLGAYWGEEDKKKYPPAEKPPLYPEYPDFLGKR